MFSKNTIINCFDFFINYEKGATYKKYEDLKKLYIENIENDFSKNSIINNLYSNIKKESVKISDFIDNESVIKVLSSYNIFNTYFSEYFGDKIETIENNISRVLDLNSIENKEQLISYCLIESLVEFSKVKTRFIPRINSEDCEHSNLYSNEILKATNDKDLFEQIADKPFGFYFFLTPIESKFMTINLSSVFTIASNQSNGVTLFKMGYKLGESVGISYKRYNVENVSTKVHKLNLKFKNKKTTEVSEYVNKEKVGFEKLEIVNKTIIIMLLSLFSEKGNKEKYEKNISSISMKKEFESESKDLSLRDTFNHDYELPFISFEELRFKGDYEFLSFLDEKFEKVTNMDIVNYTNNDVLASFEIITKFIEDIEDRDNINNYFKNKFIAKNLSYEDFNQYDIKNIKFEDSYVGIERSFNKIMPLKNTMAGTKEEIYKECFETAKINKMSLYLYYIKRFKEVVKDKPENEILDFFKENIESLINDDEFISLLTNVGSSENRVRCQNNHSKNILSDEELTIHSKDIIKGKRATHLVSISINNIEVFEYLNEYYDFKFSEDTMFFIKCFLASHKIEEMFKESNSKERFNLNNIMNSDSLDIELNRWLIKSSLVDLCIPLTNKDFKEFISKCNCEILDLKVRDFLLHI